MDSIMDINQANLDILDINYTKDSQGFCRCMNEIELPEDVIETLPSPKLPFRLYQAPLVAKQKFNARSNKMKLVRCPDTRPQTIN